MIVNIEMIKAIQDMRVIINLAHLEDMEFYENGEKLDISPEIISDFKFTGLNNMDFVTSGAYKEQERGEGNCAFCEEHPCACDKRPDIAVHCTLFNLNCKESLCENCTPRNCPYREQEKAGESYDFTIDCTECTAKCLYRDKETLHCPLLKTKEQVKPNGYTKSKNTCTDCDKGPCDRTLTCPCDDDQEYYCTHLGHNCLGGSCGINPNSVRCAHREKIVDQEVKNV